MAPHSGQVESDGGGSRRWHPVWPCVAALALALAALLTAHLIFGVDRWVLETSKDLLIFGVIAVPFAAFVHSRRSREAGALRRQNDALHELVERSSDIVFRLDPRGRITYVNAAAGSVYGYEPAAMIGMSLLDLTSEASRAADTEAFQGILQGGEFRDHETVQLGADGRAVHLAISARAVRDRAGVVTGVEGIAHDVSERMAAMEALLEAHDAAARAAQAKAVFLANMSHEIRTPMHGVLGTTRLLLQSGITGEPRRLAELVRESGESLMTVLDQVLDFSKLESGRVQLDRTVFDLSALATGLVRMNGAQAMERGIDLAVVTRPGVPAMVSGDGDRIRQVLANLIGNALKFTPRDGTVELELADEPVTEGVPRIRFSVRDTGIGISTAQIARIFDEFGQADASTTRRFGGTGLGLTISRQLVQLMAGDIEVRSEPGQGSTFTFAIPLERLPDCRDAVAGRTSATELLRVAAAGTRPSSGAAGRSFRILLAEDNGVNQLIATALLRRRGHTVAVAQNGRQAVDEAAQHPFDIILMDVQMPELDGLGATVEIRGRGLTVPIVALTAHALADERARCLAVGMDDVLTKPYAPEALFQAVERWARAPGAGPAGAEPVPADDPGAASAVVAEGIAVASLRESLRSAGVESLLDELLAGFRRDAPGRAAAIEAGLQAGDAAAVARAAHAYKGSAGAVSARALAKVLGELEAAGRNGDITATRFLAARMRKEHDRVLAQLAAGTAERVEGAGRWSTQREVACTG